MGDRINIGTLNNQNTIKNDSENIKTNSIQIKSNSNDMNNSISNADTNILSSKSNIDSVNTSISNIKSVTDYVDTTMDDEKVIINNIDYNINGGKISAKDMDNKMASSKVLLNKIHSDINHVNSEATALSTSAHALRLNAGSINDDIATEKNQDEIIKILNNVNKPKRYGVRIKKSEPNPYTRVEYTYDAVGMTPAKMNYSMNKFNYGDWGDIWFIKDNYPCMLKYNGVVDYKLNPNDYTKKEDGTASDVSNLSYKGNAMSRFPLIWTQFREDDDYEYITVCEEQYDETYLPIGFVNDYGVVKSEMFISMFKGFKYDIIRSLIKSDMRITEYFNNPARLEFEYAKDNGPGWCTRTWAQRTLINALLTIISKSDDTQSAFGYGKCNGSSPQYYSTGESCNRGQFWGSNYSLNLPVKIFHIEDWWGAFNDRIAGLVKQGDVLYYKMHGPYVIPLAENDKNDYLSAGYIPLEIGSYTSSETGVFIKNSVLGSYGRIPNSSFNNEATSSTYQCDTCYRVAGSSTEEIKVAMVGGSSLDEFGCGAHTLSINQGPNSMNRMICPGLSFIEP